MIVLAWVLALQTGLSPLVFPDYEDCLKVAKLYNTANCVQVKVFVDGQRTVATK